MVEQLRAGVSARKARVCIFDFDGTISLIRSGWSDVMVPMMVEILLDLNTGESEEELGRVVEDFVWRLTGKQTIYQMIELASQIRQRGGRPLEPLAYKKMYLDRLHDRIRYRLEELRQGKVPPEKYLVPGARELVLALRERGLAMYLASGTDQEYMREEARLLDIAPCSRRPACAAMSSSASATVTWKSRTSRKWVAWPWAWPPRSRSARWWTNGSGGAWPAWAPISSSPISSAARN
jgi:beta-phosphoglucomutase-like phosphatase (HAD superfamily)